MQLVSAVKMRKAQQIALEGRPYRELLESIIHRISPLVDPTTSSILGVRADMAKPRDLYVFISSNKGLCGAFNLNLFRLLLRQINFKESDFITVGKKGSLFVSRMKGNVTADFSTGVQLAEVSAIFQLALESFLKGECRKVFVVYNKFISTLRSEPVKQQLLPLVIETPVVRQEEAAQGEYVIEPSAGELMEHLLRSFVEEKIRGAILNSEAVEHSARMIAMKNATDNANDVIYNLTLLGNKLRQEKITMELLDMITAKESVEIS